jgi:hypothetical protein
VRLAQLDVAEALVDLQPEVEGEQCKVSHLELLLHLLLKLHDLIHHHPGDHETDVHTDDEPVTSLPASAVDGMLVLTLAKPRSSQSLVELFISRMGRLAQAIECPPKPQYLAFISNDDKTLRLLYVHLLREFSVEECGLHVHVVDFLAFISSES